MTDINIHASEPAATVPLDPGTTAGLTALKSSLGDKGPAQFAATDASLAIVARGLAAAINDKTSQAKALAMNKASLLSSPLQVPVVKPSNLDSGIQGATGGLASIHTPDTAKLQQAAASASQVRDPSALQKFNSKQIDLTSNQIKKDISTLVNLLKTVNSLRKAIQST